MTDRKDLSGDIVFDSFDQHSVEIQDIQDDDQFLFVSSSVDLGYSSYFYEFSETHNIYLVL